MSMSKSIGGGAGGPLPCMSYATKGYMYSHGIPVLLTADLHCPVRQTKQPYMACSGLESWRRSRGKMAITRELPGFVG